MPYDFGTHHTIVDVGGEVFVASPRDEAGAGGAAVAVRSRVDSLHWLDIDTSDPDTNEYFAALSSDLGPLTRSARDADVPIRVVDHAEPVDPRGVVMPFVGARLRDWAARCLVSPYGYLYSRVRNRLALKVPPVPTPAPGLARRREHRTACKLRRRCCRARSGRDGERGGRGGEQLHGCNSDTCQSFPRRLNE